MWNELFITFNNRSLFLELLSYYSKASERGLIRVIKMRKTSQELLKLPEMPFLVTLTGEIISEDNSLSETIAKIGGVHDTLFGRTKEEINSNLDFFNSVRKISEDEQKLLSYLNQHLLRNTFCNGNHITASDLYAYAFVTPILQTLRDDDKWNFCNIIRWVDHIQSLNGLKEKVRELRLRIPLPYDPLFFEPEEDLKHKSKKEKAQSNLIK